MRINRKNEKISENMRLNTLHVRNFSCVLPLLFGDRQIVEYVGKRIINERAQVAND